ncbi:MAG: DUF494 family protein [Calditrichia bacterium]
MEQKVIEIIEILLTEITRQQDARFPDVDLLSKKLLEKGYTEIDIEAAVEWISEIIEQNDEPESDMAAAEHRFPSFRVLNELEQRVFSPEAHGYLLQLHMLNLVTSLQLESIIDRCLMIGMDGIGLPDVKVISLQVILGKKIRSTRSNSFFFPGNETIH